MALIRLIAVIVIYAPLAKQLSIGEVRHGFLCHLKERLVDAHDAHAANVEGRSHADEGNADKVEHHGSYLDHY